MLNFAECERLVSTARDKRSKPIANNTRVERRDENTYALRLHSTDIATFYRDGRIVLNSGGWRTNTTAARLREYVTSHLYSERGEWYVESEPTRRDPEPERGERTVLKPFDALDPGSEPVDTGEGCIAGEIRTEPFEREVLVSRSDIKYGQWSEDDIVKPYDGSSDYFLGYAIKRGDKITRYGRESWGDKPAPVGETDETEYKQCPHCLHFARVRAAWHTAMYGGGYGRDRTNGYKAMRDALDKYGSREAWQEAYLADFRQAREQRREHKAWVERNRVRFSDGMEINADGYAPRPNRKELERAASRHRKLERSKRRINEFVSGAVRELKENGLPMPGPGDCWYCALIDENGKPWGDMSSCDHLDEHIREGYYVPSMFVNALRERGYHDAGVYIHLGMRPEDGIMGGAGSTVNADTVARDLRRYLYRRLIPELAS